MISRLIPQGEVRFKCTTTSICILLTLFYYFFLLDYEHSPLFGRGLITKTSETSFHTLYPPYLATVAQLTHQTGHEIQGVVIVTSTQHSALEYPFANLLKLMHHSTKSYEEKLEQARVLAINRQANSIAIKAAMPFPIELWPSINTNECHTKYATTLSRPERGAIIAHKEVWSNFHAQGKTIGSNPGDILVVLEDDVECALKSEDMITALDKELSQLGSNGLDFLYGKFAALSHFYFLYLYILSSSFFLFSHFLILSFFLYFDGMSSVF